MSIELKVPEIGESITEVEIGDWFKKEGETVQKDDPIVALESEKATVELSSPDTGTISKTLKKKGDVAKVGEVIGYLENGKSEVTSSKAEAKAPEKSTVAKLERKSEEHPEPRGEKIPQPPRLPPPEPLVKDKPRSQRQLEHETAEPPGEKESIVTPQRSAAPRGAREEEVVPMSRLRRTVAERLVEAQRNAALLTTFNEIDMTGIQGLRKEFGEAFQKKYNVKLGFMSFFVKASIDALKQFPAINSEVRGTDIVYHNYFDIGVAIGSGKGLVVPVLRHAERMSFAEIEMSIGDFGRRAKENKLKPEELQGGTFTISNGGVYGSLLSTPIVNPPQSGVLGMHAIQERPVAHQGAVVIRPMMYIALTYDHRIVDGREAVTFLKRMKEILENPARMLMEI
ncbi:MAG TPA: 2-oxoglutarate dehydrogenase complex dihydrolipoyllysine-residue succinyltransferase [Candidatus Paceibacterota bacterium]|nr:2-oxoglutarate dehydrogenase complex dihydrolipoyllysine-residue succinyltransferase [Candidatus Paceibacterota bacterium]